MTNADFWQQIDSVISGGFTSDGLQMLDYYAELFINGRLVYKRFSPFEQHGCQKSAFVIYCRLFFALLSRYFRFAKVQLFFDMTK